MLVLSSLSATLLLLVLLLVLLLSTHLYRSADTRCIPDEGSPLLLSLVDMISENKDWNEASASSNVM